MTTEQLIVSEGKYIAERINHKYSIKLYEWKGSFYEVTYEYCDDHIYKAEQVCIDDVLDLHMEAMNRTGTPPISDWDKEENLREVGKMVKAILEKDHPDFLNKLYWDEKLHWFCDVIEVKAAYLVDEILTGGMLVTEVRDIAVKQLLEKPKESMKPPYIKFDDYNNSILFPWWFMNRKSQQGWLIEDELPYGNGISEVMNRLDSYGGWENSTGDEYWEEQYRIANEKEKLKKNKQ